MNILYIDNYAGSVKHGRSFRPYYLGRQWKERNIPLFVVAGSYSHLRKEQPPKTGFETIDGIHYLWLWTPKYKGNGILRFVSMIVFVFQLFLNMPKILKWSKPEKIIASSVYMLDIFPGWCMKKITKSTLFFELHDVWPPSLIEFGGMPKYHPFVLLIAMAEWFAYKLSDKTISILPCAYPRAQKFGVAEKDFFHVPNGVVISDWENQVPISQEMKQKMMTIKESNTFSVGYAGAMGKPNFMSAIVEAAKQIQDKNIHFFFVGGGTEKQKIIDAIAHHKLENITVFSHIDKKQIPSFLSFMDVVYVGSRPRDVAKYGSSTNKVFDYMMAKKPIIYGINSTNDFTKDGNCGVSVNPEDTQDLVSKIVTLSNCPKKELQQMGENGHAYVLENHTYKKLGNDFLEALSAQ